MANVIEITDFSAPELDVYARMTEGQLLNREYPEKGIFIAESPKVIERATKEHLLAADTFEAFLEAVGYEMDRECDRMMAHCNEVRQYAPEILLSSFIQPTVARGRTLQRGGAKYNNYGFHGSGMSTAADALAAIRAAF